MQWSRRERTWMLLFAGVSTSLALLSGCFESSDEEEPGATCAPLLGDPWAIVPDATIDFDAGTDADADADDADADDADADDADADDGAIAIDADLDVDDGGGSGGPDAGDLDATIDPDVVLDMDGTVIVDAGGGGGMDASGGGMDAGGGGGMDASGGGMDAGGGGMDASGGGMDAGGGGMDASGGGMDAGGGGVDAGGAMDAAGMDAGLDADADADATSPTCSNPVPDDVDTRNMPTRFAECLANADCTGILDGNGHPFGMPPNDGGTDAGADGGMDGGASNGNTCLAAILVALHSSDAELSTTYSEGPLPPYTSYCEPQVPIDCGHLEALCGGRSLPKPKSGSDDDVARYENMLFNLYLQYLPPNQAAVCVEITMNDTVPGQQDPIIAMMTRDMKQMGVFPPQDPVLIKNAVARANGSYGCPIPPAQPGRDYKFSFVRGNYADAFFQKYRPEKTMIVADSDHQPHTNTVNAVPIIFVGRGPAWDFVPANGLPPGTGHPVTFAVFIQDPTGSCSECRGTMAGPRPSLQ